jgi:hypothetical protein
MFCTVYMFSDALLCIGEIVCGALTYWLLSSAVLVLGGGERLLLRCVQKRRSCRVSNRDQS